MDEGCQDCDGIRLMNVSTKCSDMFNAWTDANEHRGYVSDGLGIGDGDYMEFCYCMECGRIQGNFPLPEHMLEREPLETPAV